MMPMRQRISPVSNGWLGGAGAGVCITPAGLGSKARGNGEGTGADHIHPENLQRQDGQCCTHQYCGKDGQAVRRR